jgi:hypothetical protein
MSTPTRPPAQITTFYSYKGGTGRTMLLANVAWILASAGKRVLVIDWDLEAPGLHQYFHPFLIDPRLEATDGLIDLVVEYSRDALTPEEHSSGQKWLDRAADIRRFVASVNWNFPNDGLLHLLPAGRQNASFSVRVNTFHWDDFYERLSGGAFLEFVKNKIQNDYGYDHILIDSRTGVSDTSGICTVQMPDRLVVCFTASEQSISGSATVASSTWAQWERLKASRRGAKTGAERERRIFPILMRIEASEKNKLDAARAHVREVFGSLPGCSGSNDAYWNRAEVAYWPFYAFEEVLAVFGDRFRTDTSLIAACEHVASFITDGEVSLLNPPRDDQRNEVLAVYERRSLGEAAVRTVDAEQPPRPGKERHWFLSYNSQDFALMQTLEAALQRNDPSAQIFAAPRSLRAGGFWMPQLADAMTQATIFVLLVGEKGISPWQELEYYEALDRRVNGVVVLLEGQTAPGLPFLRDLQWIVTANPASEQCVARLIEISKYSGRSAVALWRHAAPYRGLAAMTEADSEFFFGRGREIKEVIDTLAVTPAELLILFGNSGVGKTSLAQAGVLAALMRQSWPETASAAGAWPQTFGASRRWCFRTLRPGNEPVRALAETILSIWQMDATDPRSEARVRNWTSNLADGRITLRDLVDSTEKRLQELDQTNPPVFFIYIDQGEELYVRANEDQRRRFSELLAAGLGDPRLRVMMSMRSEFLGYLQEDEALYAVHRKIDVPPLREAELREVVNRPAALLDARFETETLAADIARRAAEESAGNVGVLPLLSYLLDGMWDQMVVRGDGVLRLPAQVTDLGGMLGARADDFLTSHRSSENDLRRIFTLKLAMVREDGEVTRRRASRDEFSEQEWRLVSALANNPYRLLVTVTSESGETYAELAHEAIFRRWRSLRVWIDSERDYLIWRSELEALRRRWQAAADPSKKDALLMGLALDQAKYFGLTRVEDLPADDRDFITQSIEAEQERQAAQQQALWVQQRALRVERAKTWVGLLVGLFIGMTIAGLAAWLRFR